MAVNMYDPWERASNPTVFSGKFWGQVQVDASLVALVKGQGKVPFDPQVHDRPATAISLAILTLAEQKISNPKVTERDMIAESDEWSKVVWASLKTLGLTSLKELNGRWALVEAVATGETYEKNGVTKEKTTFKFLQLFQDEAACRADYELLNGKATQAAPAQTPPPTQPQAPGASANGKTPAEKAAAFMFAKAFVQNIMRGSVGKPLDEVMNLIGQKLAESPTTAKYFTADSPEIIDLIANYGQA